MNQSLFKSRKFLFLLAILFLYSCTEDQLPFDTEGDLPDIPSVVVKNSDYLFDLQAFPLIRLEVPLQGWNDLLAWYDRNPHNEECTPVTVRYIRDGETVTVPDTGLRLRGNTSRRRPEGVTGMAHNAVNPDWHHCHFALKFAEFVDDQRLFGLDRLNLKWHKDDAAYCREVYCYDLFRRFGVWSAPRASYCRLEIVVEGDATPAYYGVYAMIEAVHNDFLTYRREQGKLLSDQSNLWKASYGADFMQLRDDQIGVEKIPLDPSQMKTYPYDLKTNKKKGFDAAKSQLQTFAAQLKAKSGNELKVWLEQNMDVELFLKAYAVNVAVGMWDDYWVNTNNYYWYFDADGKFIFIPYDYDNALGTSLLLDNAGTQNPLAWGSDQNRPLIRQVLSVPEYRALYQRYLKELADPQQDLLATLKSRQRILSWHALIKNDVANDTGEDMVIGDKPAGWGNCPFYRLLSGNDKGGADGQANFFATRCAVINRLP